MPLTSVFTKKAHRFLGPNSVWLILAIVICVIAIAGFYAGVKGAYYMVPGGLALMGLYRTSLTRTEDIVFFVNRDENNEYYFSYKDEDKQQTEPERIDVYQYWYYPNGQSGNKTQYHLIFMIESASGMHCLKEKLLLSAPPKGWEHKNEIIKDEKEVLLVPDLQLLAMEIDKNSIEVLQP